MTIPRISVIIPSFNHEQYVEQAIESVFRQDIPELEVVIVDDGSTDSSCEIIARVLHRENRPNVIFHEQTNAGTHAALKRGIELSSGEVIAILNSERRFSQLQPHFSRNSDFLIFSGLELIDTNGEKLPPHAEVARWYQLALRQAVQCPTVGYALLCNNFCVTSSNLIFSRSLYERVGGFRPYRLCHDWDFILRCGYFVEPVFVPEPLAYYRRHESNTINERNWATIDKEYQQFVTDFLRSCEEQRPKNPLSPCRANWPFYFPYFVRTHTQLSTHCISEFVVEEPLAEFPTDSFVGNWQPWNNGVVKLSNRNDLGVLQATENGASSHQRIAQECGLLLRELALVRLGMHTRHESFAPPGIADLELAQLWRDLIPACDANTTRRN